MLSDKEKYRYDRQIKLADIGLSGQEKLKSARVLVVGAGGLGCPVLQYLAAAGLGKIGVIDFDTVNETNLHRQILFNQKDIGNNKAFAAVDKLKSMNSFVTVESYPKRLDNELAIELFPNYDIIVDCTDNFTTRYLINDACVLFQKPFISGSVFKTEGQVSVFNYKNGPTYRCLFPKPPAQTPSCEEVGIMGVLCGITGAKQANEVLKMVTGTGEILSGKMELYNSLVSTTSVFSFSKNPASFADQPKTKEAFKNYNYAQFCGELPTRFQISSDQLKELMQKNAVQLFDIRQEWEDPEIDYSDVVRIPLQEIEKAVSVLSREKSIVVVCHYGTRSKIAVDYLRMRHRFKDVLYLTGGLNQLKVIAS